MDMVFNDYNQQSPASCDLFSEWRPQQELRSNLRRLSEEMSENGVEYTVDGDDNDIGTENDSETVEDSSSTESDEENKTPSKHTNFCSDDPESDGSSNSSLSDCSSEYSLNSKATAAAPPNVNSSICAACGKGPFRLLKLHLLHCRGIQVEYECSLCKRFFLTEAALNEHYMPLYACKICGQVFSHESFYHPHQCPKEGRLPLVFFCSEVMPKVCNICKSFFTSEKTLFNHVTRVHTSVVSTKKLMITNPSVMSDRKVSPGVRGSEVHSASSGPNLVSQVHNGTLHVDQTYAGSHASFAKSSPSPSSASPTRLSEPAPLSVMLDAATVKLEKDDQHVLHVDQMYAGSHASFAKSSPSPSSASPTRLSEPAPLSVMRDAATIKQEKDDQPILPDTTDSPATVASEPVSPPTPTIMAISDNDNQNVALMKRMDMGWSTKVPYSCRECGAIISHLHRGRPSHQCQCGHAFILDNSHLPRPLQKVPPLFGNVGELNKQAEIHCSDFAPFEEAPALISAVGYPNMDMVFNDYNQQSPASCDLFPELRPQQRIEIKSEKTETSEDGVEYTVDGDDNDIGTESDGETVEDSSSTESDEENKTPSIHTSFCSDDPESDGSSYSSLSDCSNEYSLNSKDTANVNSSICAACGKGPFRLLKLHLLHCRGIQVEYECSLCKRFFLTEAALNEHYMPLYACKICGQVFSHESSYHPHQCPKEGRLPLAFFCSEVMPKVCNICKSFFTSQQTLRNHVTRVHMSVVSSKKRMITNPSVMSDRKVSPGVHGSEVHSASSGPNLVSQVHNGTLHVDQTYARSHASFTKSSPSSSSASPTCLSEPAPLSVMRDAATMKQEKDDQPILPDTTDSPATVASEPVSPPMPTFMAISDNDNQNVALMKRMNMGWRAKVPYSCRGCGAILRQLSSIISHRYRHRGRRSHHCYCGRAFKHRLHLLRHCVQHAEAESYICVSCGETFIGARHLAEHIQGKSQKKCQVKGKCRMPLACDCGRLFLRPSALIWHQIQIETKTNEK